MITVPPSWSHPGSMTTLMSSAKQGTCRDDAVASPCSKANAPPAAVPGESHAGSRRAGGQD